MLLRVVEKIVDAWFAMMPQTKPDDACIRTALLIAHRGAHQVHRGIRENTMQAFAAARDLGCWGIELDIQCTADGVFVVHHDPDLRRLWNHDAFISQLSFASLRQLAPDVPSLAEVIDEFGHSLHLFIELKTPITDEYALFERLRTLKPVQDYHLITLSSSLFQSLSLWPKDALLLVASHNNVSELCQLSLKSSYAGVLANYLLLSTKHRQQLLAAQQMFGVGQINSKNSFYRELKKQGRWIFTDQAARLSALISK